MLKTLLITTLILCPILNIHNYNNEVLTHNVVGCNIKLNNYHPKGIYRTVVVEQDGDWYITEHGKIHRNLVKELWCS